MEKNPISIVNEFGQKNNVKIDFEYTTDRDGYIVTVLKGGRVIGKGSDKKKQKAKMKAAESALKILYSAQQCNWEARLNEILGNNHKKGVFKKIGNSPPFGYEYYVQNMLVAKGYAKTEELARELCAKNAITKLSTLKPFKAQANLLKKQTDEQETSIKTEEESSQYHMDDAFFDRKLLELSLTNEQLADISTCCEVVKAIGENFCLQVINLGSQVHDAIRENKLELDFGIILPEPLFGSCAALFEILEQARLLFLESKERGLTPVEFVLPMAVEQIERPSAFYPFSKFIRLHAGSLSCNLYFCENAYDAGWQHYLWADSQKISKEQWQLLKIIRCWKSKLDFEVPIELLDLLVIRSIDNAGGCSQGLRNVFEKLAGGIFLSDSGFKAQEEYHIKFLAIWPIELQARLMQAAQKALLAFVTNSLSEFLFPS
jgi:hypothetical protein